MSMLGILVLATFANLVGTGLFLWIGARWAKVPNASLVRCFWTTLVAAIGSSAVCGACMLASSRSYVSPITALGLAVAATLLVSWLIIMVLLRTSFVRAVLSSLPTLVPDIAVGIVLWAALASYASATHGMAPTLLGFHNQGVCPYCGRVTTVAADPVSIMRVEWEQPWAICGSCGKSSSPEVVDPTVHAPDRYLVNKWVKPHRWDVVVYRATHDPKVRYVTRLIGLPGEELVVNHSGIWINGVKVQPPAELVKQGFFVSDSNDFTTLELKVKLGADECYVLSDFAPRVRESRERGPIPAGNIEGVVGMIISPIPRIRMFP